MGRQRINLENVQTIIKALLLSQGEAIYTGVPMAKLDNDYYHTEGMRIPFRRLGHSCLFDFLQTLTNTLTVKYKNRIPVVFPILDENSKEILAHSLQQVSRTNYIDVGPAGDTDNDSENDFVSHAASTTRDVKPASRQNNKKPQNNKRRNNKTPSHDDCHKKTMRDIVNDTIKQHLRDLISKYPDGIWCADLPTLYEEEYKVPLNYEELGIYSVLSFASYLPDVFHCIQPQDKGDYKLYDARVEKPTVQRNKKPVTTTFVASYNGLNDESPEPVPPLSMEIANRLIPDAVMKIGETVAQISVTELNQDPNDTIEVVVVEVFTPSFFWIQLRERMPHFELFMNKLHDFYEMSAGKYLIPPAIIAKGLNCACKYEEQWHRGIITNITDDRNATILFYDYGTLETYKPDGIHFLHRSFINPPAQAIPCGLYNIKPLGTAKWSTPVTVEFAHKVFAVPLVAMIAQIDTENNSMLIGLTDTSGKEDLHINDWLIDKGYAEYGKMVCIRPPNYTFRRFLECNYVSSSDKNKRSTLCSSSKNIPILAKKNAKPRELFSNPRDKDLSNILSTFHSSQDAGENLLKSRIMDNSLVPTMRHKDKNFLNFLESRSFEDEENVDTNNRSRYDVTTNGIELSGNNPSPNRSSKSANFDDNLDVCRDRTNHIVPCISTSSVYKDTSKSNCVTNKNDRTDELLPDMPLHLKPPTTEKLNDFGTMRSRYGGSGRMEPIEWFTLCKSKKIVNEMNHPIASSNLGSIIKRPSDIGSPMLPADEKALPFIEQSFSVKETNGCDNSNMRIIVENKKNSDRTNQMPADDSPSSPKLPKSKRTLWNLVKSHTDKTTSRNDQIGGKDNDENPTPFTKKIEEPSDKSMETKTILHTNNKIVDVTENVSSNRETISEFSHFCSMLGGNNNKEPVTWCELRELTKNSNRPMEVATPKVTSNAVPRKSRMPLNLREADKTWLKIINSNDNMNYGAVSRNSLWVPEGNISMGSDFTSTLRAMTKGLEKDSNDHVRIFIPNEMLELMKPENITEDSSSSDDTNKNKTSPVSSLEVSSNLSRESQELNDENASLDLNHSTELALGKISEVCSTEKPLNGSLSEIPKDCNTLIENVRLNLDGKQLLKLIEARLDSMNDSISDLDSDDLSFTEETKLGIDVPVDDSLAASLSKRSDGEVSVKVEDPMAPEHSRINIDDTEMQLSARDCPVIDTDALNSDDYLDEWDFQPGWFVNSKLDDEDIDEDNFQIDDSMRVQCIDERAV